MISPSEQSARRYACPRCAAPLHIALTQCPGCSLAFRWQGPVIDVLGPTQRETKAEEVEEFYTRSPFPGYAPGDTASTLLDRSRQSSFLVALDRAIPSDGRFLSIGCGTAQVPAFLSLAGPRRRVFGVDGCSASLALAGQFAQKVGIENLQLVRADLFDLPLPAESFDVVSCRGVVHHTPDPYRAIELVARLVAPGGTLVLGYYETMGRAWHRTRRVFSNLRSGRPIRMLDPILRRRDIDDEKKRIWIEDQYRHPLEYSLPTPKVLRHLQDLGFEFTRTVPPSPEGGLFDALPTPGRGALFRQRFAWMLAGLNDPDAGLVILVVHKAHNGQKQFHESS